VAALEDVLEVYTRPYDEARPVVCVDEGGKQLIGDVRPPLPTRPGKPQRIDAEYSRHGTANLFMVFDVIGRFKSSHLWALQNQPRYKGIFHPLFPTLLLC